MLLFNKQNYLLALLFGVFIASCAFEPAWIAKDNKIKILWQRVDLSIPEGDAMRAVDVTLVIEQDRGPTYQSAAATDDNYGLGAISFFYDSSVQQTFISTGGATLAGNVDEGGQPLDGSLDTGIDEVRREVTAQQAGIVTTDGTFTMSSSTPITTTAIVTAENNIPLITKYHRVKYLIKAL